MFGATLTPCQGGLIAAALPLFKLERLAIANLPRRQLPNWGEDQDTTSKQHVNPQAPPLFAEGFHEAS